MPKKRPSCGGGGCELKVWDGGVGKENGVPVSIEARPVGNSSWHVLMSSEWAFTPCQPSLDSFITHFLTMSFSQ